MANSKGKGPHPLDPRVVKRLLDGLTNDPAFRARFETDAKAALESIGYVAPTDDSLHAGSCMQLQSGATLASPERIASARTKLETSLSAIQDFACPAYLME
jgi:putative modified peptide